MERYIRSLNLSKAPDLASALLYTDICNLSLYIQYYLNLANLQPDLRYLIRLNMEKWDEASWLQNRCQLRKQEMLGEKMW